MSLAITSIVDGYVSLGDRIALEAIRDHRLRLLSQLRDQQPGWMDPTSTIQLLDEDLQAVELGLARLGPLAHDA
jgi:hypothetical protein